MLKISQELPKEQKSIILTALLYRESKLMEFVKKNKRKNIIDVEIDSELFDILVLKQMLNYEINVVLTKSELDNFTNINGVSLPFSDVKSILNIRPFTEIETEALGVELDKIEMEYDDMIYSVNVVNFTNEIIDVEVEFEDDITIKRQVNRDNMKAIYI